MSTNYEKKFVFRSGWIPLWAVMIVPIALGVMIGWILFMAAKPAQAWTCPIGDFQCIIQQGLDMQKGDPSSYSPPLYQPAQPDGLAVFNENHRRQYERYMDWQAQRQIEANKETYRNNLRRCAPYNRACAQELYGLGQ